jgi:hypothetical protein
MRDATYLRRLAERHDPDALIEMIKVTSQEVVLMWPDDFIALKPELQYLVEFNEDIEGFDDDE